MVLTIAWAAAASLDAIVLHPTDGLTIWPESRPNQSGSRCGTHSPVNGLPDAGAPCCNGLGRNLQPTIRFTRALMSSLICPGQ